MSWMAIVAGSEEVTLQAGWHSPASPPVLSCLILEEE